MIFLILYLIIGVLALVVMIGEVPNGIGTGSTILDLGIVILVVALWPVAMVLFLISK